MRKFYYLLLSLIVVLVVAVPSQAQAYSYLGAWFRNDAIDTNNDDKFDLSVCFDTTTTGALYVNRSNLMDDGLKEWNVILGNWALPNGWDSYGVCDGDGSNIHIKWGSASGFGNTCSTWAKVQIMPNAVGYSEIDIYFNPTCSFDWDDTNGTDGSKASAPSVLAHEVGHTLGLAHWNAYVNAAMHDGGPAHCFVVGKNHGIADDDADGVQARYSGVLDFMPGPFQLDAPCFT